MLDAENGCPLGLSTVQLWKREPDHKDQKERSDQNLPIEEQESYKWLKSAEKTDICFSRSDVKIVTHIGARESDIFAEFVRVPNQQNHRLIRVAQNCQLLDQPESLYTYLSQQPCQGTYPVEVQADSRVERTAREALLCRGVLQYARTCPGSNSTSQALICRR